jgi:hypothetical protein
VLNIIVEWLGRLAGSVEFTPTGFDNVNFDGVLAFSLGQHRARILPSSSPPEVPDRAVG